MKLGIFGTVVIGLALAGHAAIANATLIGQNVTGMLSAGARGNVVTPFTSPATIGAGIEFNGVVQDNTYFDVFVIDVDFTTSTVSVTITYPSGPGQLGGGAQAELFEVDFTFSDSPGITSVVASATNPVRGVSALSFGPGSINIDFFTEFAFSPDQPQTWLFNITQQAVPNPASLALVCLGLAGLAGAARRRAG